MTRDELFQLHQDLCGKALELMKSKNADYSKEGPFGNLTLCESAQIVSTEHGILVRMLDKMSRLNSVLARGSAQVNESIEDTVLDLVNYAVLIAAVRRSHVENP